VSDAVDLFEDPTDTHDQILEATFHALCEHGYSNLTLERIGAEFEKSTSLVYHHYDGKDDLLYDLLEYLLDRYEAEVPLSEDDPETQIRELIETAFGGEFQDGFGQALVELRAQATHDPEFRRLFERTDAFVIEHLARLIRAGVEAGTFADVDADRTAALIYVSVVGVHTVDNTSTSAVSADAIDELEALFETHLLR